MSVLMAIGGNMRLDGSISHEFFERCGGPEARLVILPTASSRQDGGKEFADAWQAMGVRCAPVVLPIRDRGQAFQPDHFHALRQASGIFFTGGNQLRLSTVLSGSPLLLEIRAAFQAGVVLAGTSAGAAVMGRIMISGGTMSSGARFGSAHFAEGFGFYEDLLFDQHFYQRHRMGRLIYGITLHPRLLGVGLDEDTGTILSDQKLTVIGKRAVTIIDGQGIVETNIDQVSSGNWFSVSGLRVHQLTNGCQFDLQTRSATIFRQPMQPE